MKRIKDEKSEEEQFNSAFINQYLNLTAPPRRIKSSKKEWKVGDLINDRYKINKIKKGGMGIVYICHDNTANEDIAIKTYIEREEYYRETIERFRSEVLTWITLGRHQNIVQAKYVLNIDERPYVFMEYIRSNDDNSPSLKILMEKGRLDQDQCLGFALQFCEGMIHAESVVPGLIHNDIKPENILITPDGTLKVSDFGLVKVFYNLSQIGNFMGTAKYTSPEQCLGLAMTDASSDIYSFGVVLYEMFTGAYPYKLEPEEKGDVELILQHLIQIPERPETIAPEIPPGLSDIIMRCLRKMPEERYRNFKELKRDLLKYYGSPLNSRKNEVPSPNFRIIEAQRYVNKGISLTTFGRYKEAIAQFELALETNPDNTEAWSRKGIALIGEGKYDEAFLCFNQYLKLKPCDVDVLNHKGSILNLQGKREEALRCFNQALDHESYCSEVLYNKAVALFALERYKEAAETLEKIKDGSVGKSREILLEACLRQSNPEYTEEKGRNIQTDGSTTRDTD